MILLLKLFMAHILGDFFLQPESWVKDKESRRLKSPKLYLHIGIHFALLTLLLWDLTLWPIILTVTGFHFVIDAIKLLFQKKKTKRLWFFIDQLLHVLSLFVAYYLFNGNIDMTNFPTEQMLLLFFCILFLTQPVSIIMKTIFSKWNISKLTEGNESLKDAGKYIGILERVLVFIFIVLDHWEAVGFLITAKSVFRFGDLKESKQRKLTEYVLIGTLISFGIAITIGIIFKMLQ